MTDGTECVMDVTIKAAKKSDRRAKLRQDNYLGPETQRALRW